MENFILNNIKEINNNIDFIKKSGYDKTKVRAYLKEKLDRDIEINGMELLEKFYADGLVRSRIKDIANEYLYYKKDLEKFYDKSIYNKFSEEVNWENVKGDLEASIKKQLNEKEYKFIYKDMNKLITKVLVLLKNGGFQKNLFNINSGIKEANEGDSSQFQFISRAILAGFNCSNVDVRSSKYDSIIDYKGTLLKVQVKGISDSKISFKERDRGGQGIDYKHENNKGKIITSSDCDIYVAVDKQCGLCYIIPMMDMDEMRKIDEKEKRSIEELDMYLENWDMIESTANRLINIR
ncbi:group I intron-associated PD-(D/E)XK endonuclease [Clostridium sp. AL.422]|uniref:group I intron-associated PD-(D/E)XK endonuclease n=1 Tax=Clostridium TaxID=1485 RepID=UPI00293DFB8C|nr:MULTISPECIES: group I intron-associated PD-(D/E)XK endonuclease [unclassified Clostridium]MDV4152123.1 group I intron-associated PD-(D/E)XK endonuclease [Clostridium sp. AL.422]